MKLAQATITPITARLTDPAMERAYRRFTAPTERRNALITVIIVFVMDALTYVIDNLIGGRPLEDHEALTQLSLAVICPTLIVLLAKKRRHEGAIAFTAMILMSVMIAFLIMTGYQMASRGAVVIIAGIMLFYLISRFTLIKVIIVTGVFTATSVPLWLIIAAENEEFDIPFILTLIGVIHIVGILEARTSQRERRMLFAAQATFEELSTRDDLTGLGNRREYYRVINSLAEGGGRPDQTHAVLLADLNHFKEINDTLGHHAGDSLLAAVAARLREAVPDAFAHIRLGGDEFVAITATDVAGDEAVAAAQRFIRALGEPIRIDDLEIRIAPSIGISVSPPAAGSSLLREADIAMYRAKSRGGGVTVFRDHDTDKFDKDNAVLAGELARSITGSGPELSIYYQPQIAIPTGEVVAVEALVRWHHPIHGLISPDRILTLARQQGLTHVLTLEVLRLALADVATWGEAAPRVAVNLAPTDLFDSDFPDEVARLLDVSGVPPSQLRLEITENTVLADPERINLVLGRLRAMGVTFALDDYGTGYSSLGYLRILPIDVLKIDRSFVTAMPREPVDRIIVQSTVDLAHGLGFLVIAEGVEDADIWRELAAIGCDGAQGFAIAPPMPADETAAWLAAHSSGFRLRDLVSRKV